MRVLKQLASLSAASIALAVLIGSPVRAQDAGLVQTGRDLFNKNCVFCHQADAIGKPGVAPSLTNKELLSNASDKYLLSTIRDGRPGTGMPPFAHLGRDGIRAIGAFLRSHSHDANKAKEVDGQHDAHGDPRLGKLWFDHICAACHGRNGDGYIAGGTGTAIGKAGFLDKASDGFIRATIKEGRSNTRMRGFQGPDGLANFSDQEIDDIIVYMRTLPNKSQ
ncbi:MAG: c-type cytochrome [Gammaproteobacteria bacterium]